jgi:hypothetical protein
MPIFCTEFYKPVQNVTGYRSALHQVLIHCQSSEERDAILSKEAIEMTHHVTEGIRDLVKHDKHIRHLVLDLGLIPLATWSDALDSLAGGSLLVLKQKINEMKHDLEQGKVEGFIGTMFLYGKPTFATLENFYDIVFEGL